MSSYCYCFFPSSHRAMEEVDATLNSDDEADYMKMDMVSAVDLIFLLGRREVIGQ